MEKIRLNILGLSYTQTQSGAYALILSEENGKRRIPIIIGSTEAQSIAIQLEGLKAPRPLTHDLFLNFATAFSINITEVLITKLEEGIFYSQLVCDSGHAIIRIDSRTSDAVALALRFKCPIYTTEEILEKAGIVMGDSTGSDEEMSKKETPRVKSRMTTRPYSTFAIEELEKMLDEAVAKEDYEKASEIRDELNKRDEK